MIQFHDESDRDDFDLDEEFPLGDGTARTSGSVTCPHCGEENDVGLDPGGGSAQRDVEDCQVCCQPWMVDVHYGADGSASISVRTLDE